MDDWDSVSNDTPPNSATDPWDAVSTPDLAAAIERRRRRQQGQPIEEEEPQVTPLLMPESDILRTGEPLEQPAATPDMAVPERAFQQEQPEDEIIEAPRRVQEPRAARPPVKRKGISASFVVIIVLCLAVIGLSVLSGLNIYLDVLTHNDKVRATATAQTKATNIENADSIATVRAFTTATAQTAATATVQLQVYNQVTNGAPAFSDSLSDNRNNRGVFTTNYGGRCKFTNGAYHIALSKAGYWLFCVPIGMTNLDNFALQVQMSIAEGNKGGVLFDFFQNNFYRVFISSTGYYVLTQYTVSNNRAEDLRTGSNSAIKTGLNQPNIMTVIVNNSNFYLYVNSQFVTSVRLNSYRQGVIGLSALSDNQPTEAVFSNFKIWTL